MRFIKHLHDFLHITLPLLVFRELIFKIISDYLINSDYISRLYSIKKALNG